MRFLSLAMLLVVVSVVHGYEISQYSVHIDITRMYARTAVSLDVQNPSSVPDAFELQIEMSKTAFVHGLTMMVAGQEYVGVVKLAEVALQEFNDAKAKGANAGMVAQVTSSSYTLSASIPANASATFSLTYEDVLTLSNGVFQFPVSLPSRLAMSSAASRAINLWLTDKGRFIKNTTLSNVVNGAQYSLSLGRLSVAWSPSSSIEEDPLRPLQLMLTLEVISESPRSSPIQGTCNSQGEYAASFTPLEGSGVVPRRVVVVIDRSGSMMGRRMAAARRAAASIIEGLNDKDSFAVVDFASDVQMWGFGSGAGVDVFAFVVVTLFLWGGGWGAHERVFQARCCCRRQVVTMAPKQEEALPAVASSEPITPTPRHSKGTLFIFLFLAYVAACGLMWVFLSIIFLALHQANSFVLPLVFYILVGFGFCCWMTSSILVLAESRPLPPPPAPTTPQSCIVRDPALRCLLWLLGAVGVAYILVALVFLAMGVQGTIRIAPSPAGALTKATPLNRFSASQYIMSLEATTGTNIELAMMRGLEVATSVPSRPSEASYVILLSDGYPTEGLTDSTALLKQLTVLNNNRVLVYTVAVSYDADLWFMERLAFTNGGHYRVVSDTAAQFESDLTSVFRVLQSPVLVGLQFVVNAVENAAPVPLFLSVADRGGALFAGTEVGLVGSVPKVGTIRIVASAIGAEGTRQEWSSDVVCRKQPNPGPQNSDSSAEDELTTRTVKFIRTRRLVDAARILVDSPFETVDTDRQRVSEAKAAALDAQLVTYYTSLIVVPKILPVDNNMGNTTTLMPTPPPKSLTLTPQAAQKSSISVSASLWRYTFSFPLLVVAVALLL